MQLIFAGAAAIAMLTFLDAARPDATDALTNSGSVHLINQATPFGGFATDDGDDQAQLQQQLAQQQMQQAAEQQAEQQNEAAQQQALQAELQAQQTEQQANQ
jgi:hypothetical protein